MVVVLLAEVVVLAVLELEHLRLFRLGQAIPLLLAQEVQQGLGLVAQLMLAGMVLILLLLVGQAHLRLLLRGLCQLVVAVVARLVNLVERMVVLEVAGLMLLIQTVGQEIHQVNRPLEVMVPLPFLTKALTEETERVRILVVVVAAVQVVLDLTVRQLLEGMVELDKHQQ